MIFAVVIVVLFVSIAVTQRINLAWEKAEGREPRDHSTCQTPQRLLSGTRGISASVSHVIEPDDIHVPCPAKHLRYSCPSSPFMSSRVSSPGGLKTWNQSLWALSEDAYTPRSTSYRLRPAAFSIFQAGASHEVGWRVERVLWTAVPLRKATPSRRCMFFASE